MIYFPLLYSMWEMGVSAAFLYVIYISNAWSNSVILDITINRTLLYRSHTSVHNIVTEWTLSSLLFSIILLEL